MQSFASAENQDRAVALAVHCEPMDVTTALKTFAARVSASVDNVPARDRMFLHDCKRDRVNFRAVARLFELAACADLRDALYGPEVLRGLLIARVQPVVPCWMDATRDEEVANHQGNLAQFEWAERRTESAAEQVIEAMTAQALASRILADSTWREAGRAKRIVVTSR